MINKMWEDGLIIICSYLFFGINNTISTMCSTKTVKMPIILILIMILLIAFYIYILGHAE